MSISFFGIAGNVADSGTASTGYANNSGNSPVSVTPPTSMSNGMLCIMNGAVNNGGTGRIVGMVSGDGQTWNAGNYYSAPGHANQFFWCQFNGTWSANPALQPAGGTATGGVSAIMSVFQSTLGASSAWAVDSNCAEVDNNLATPSSPFNLVIPGQSPVSNNSVTFAWYVIGTAITLALQTAGWANPGSNSQWRNQGAASGQPICLSMAYLLNTAAGATGSVTNQESAAHSAAGNIITFTDGSVGTVNAILTPPKQTFVNEVVYQF